MTRLIKRYGGGSRKLYDTRESRYVSLDEIARWIRDGEQVKVVDNATGDDVTAQTLAQVILEAERRGSFLGSELLHHLIHRGERALSSGVEQIQSGVDRIVRGLTPAPIREVHAEVSALRARLEALERSLETEARGTRGASEDGHAPPRGRGKGAGAKRATRKRD